MGRVGHLIGNRPVDVVADTGEDRDRGVGDRVGDLGVIKHGKIGFRPTAANDKDDVDVGIDCSPDGCGDGALRPGALHCSVDLNQRERSFTAFEHGGDISMGG